MHGTRILRWSFLGALLALSGCGAGLVSGAVASGNGNNAGSQPPSLSLPGQDVPLVPVPTARARTVVVANAVLSATAALRVQLRVHATADLDSEVLAAADQRSPTILSGQGGSTVIGFNLDTEPIVAALGATADLNARLAVLVNGREVGVPVPVTLLRQPVLRLFDGEPLFVSPLGGQRVRLAATGLRSLDAAAVEMSVTTVDPTGVATSVTRACLRPAFDLAGGQDPLLRPGERLFTAEAPGNTFSGPAEFVVDDAIAGRSTIVAGAFYQPDIAVALPAQGSTRGGTKVTLFGRALAPLRSDGPPGVADFDQLEVQFRKGDRVTTLSDVGLHRDESSLDRLVFTMPPSPDGRPGDVGIVLRTRLRQGVAQPEAAEVVAEVVADGKFLFANPDPVFSPRGTVLAGDPIAVSPIALEGAPNSSQATDFGVLYSQGNFASVQLLLAQENGMFIRYFGLARRIGDPGVPAERDPRDLLTGDFNGDAIPDLLIVNAGLGTAVHHIVLGQQAPAPPLGDVVRFSSPAGMNRGRVCDLDRDGADDVVLFPGPGTNGTPIVLLQRTVGGVPGFAPPIAVPLRTYAYDSFEIADMDGDGLLDIAVVSAGVTMRLDVAYGDGNGGFAASTFLDFLVPGYLSDPAAPAVGLHAMGAAPCSMAVVLSGLPAVLNGSPPLPAAHPTTPPMVVLVRPAGNRGYVQPVGGTTGDVLLQAGAIDPFRSSLAVNLDGSGPGKDELLVGATGDKAVFALGFFRLEFDVNPLGRFKLVPILQRFDAKELGALFLGIAFPANPLIGQLEVPAVFVKHQISVDGELEQRLSTLLVAADASDVQMLPPDVGFGIALAGVVGGRFSATGIASGGATRDLAVPSGPNVAAGTAARIVIGVNNGFGALAPGNEMTNVGLVPETTTRVPGPPGVADSLAFLDDGTRHGRVDGQLRVGVWRPDTDAVPNSFSLDLRPLLPPSLATAPIDDSSHLQAEDIDGDGLLDLTLLLRFAQLRSDGEAVLMVLRGRPTASVTEFPFDLPEAGVVTAVHGSATSFALGDFAPEGVDAPVRRELALAVPFSSTSTADDGNHVQFFRLVAAVGGMRWQRSFATLANQVLVAGNAPSRVAADDFDRNGTIDLLVAADESLWLFLNSGQPGANPAEVAIQSFHEVYGAPLTAERGQHTNLLLGDINGDGNVDALLATEFRRVNGTLTSSVVFYLSSGTGEFSNFRLVSPTRLGDRDARLSVDLGDINSDGVPDLSIGWFQTGGGGDNLRVLLGGSR